MGQVPYFVPVRPEDTIPPGARLAAPSPLPRAPTPFVGASAAPQQAGVRVPAAAAGGPGQVPTDAQVAAPAVAAVGGQEERDVAGGKGKPDAPPEVPPPADPADAAQPTVPPKEAAPPPAPAKEAAPPPAPPKEAAPPPAKEAAQPPAPPKEAAQPPAPPKAADPPPKEAAQPLPPVPQRSPSASSDESEGEPGIIFIRSSERLKKREPLDLRDFAEDAPEADQRGDLTILEADLRYDEDDETVEPPPRDYNPLLSDDEEYYPENDDDLRIEVDELDALRADQEEDAVRPESAIEISDTEAEEEKEEYDPIDFDDPQVLYSLMLQ